MNIYEIPIEVEVEGKMHIVFPERMDKRAIARMKVEQGSYVFGCQNYLNPIPKDKQKFLEEWLLYWEDIPKFIKIIICVDPSSTDKAYSDYTSITVHAWDENQNWYVLDIYRDKLSKESARSKKVFALHRKWSPYAQNRIPVLYETLSFQISDKHYIERQQEAQDYTFPIHEMSGKGFHTRSKMSRICALQPYFESNVSTLPEDISKKIYLPKTCIHYSFTELKKIDMTQEFIGEYVFFTPDNTHLHDDMLDSCTFPLYWDGWKNIKASVRKEVKKKTKKTWSDLENEMNRRHKLAGLRVNRGSKHI